MSYLAAQAYPWIDMYHKRGEPLDLEHAIRTSARAGAKELHHVLINTDPKLVSWCFDGDWIYRGTGQSALAVYDLAKLYGERVTVLHVRQSH